MINNAYVNQGFSFQGIKWAFTSFHCGYWIPLTWLSHMLDCQLFGLNSGYHHLTNIVLHFLNSILIFILFCRLQKERGKAFLIGVFFLIHPLAVETVSWIGDRKGCLSMFFGLLSLLSYCKFSESKDRKDYLRSLLLYITSLMAKPMLITLPLIIIIFEYYQGKNRSLKKEIFLEKIHFFLIALIFGVLTIISKQDNIYPLADLSLLTRLHNIFSSYLLYLYKFILPQDLYIFYPLDFSEQGVMAFIFSASIFIALTIIFVYQNKRKKGLIHGWLLFVTAIVPMIGIVQDSAQKMADRFFYFPGIGLYWLLAELIFPLQGKCSYWKKLLIFLLIFFWGISCSRQVQVWESSEKIWRHALSFSADKSVIANIKYALICLKRDDTADAEQYLKNALLINPGNTEALINLGVVYEKNGDSHKAEQSYVRVLQKLPDHYQALMNLGNIFFNRKDYEKALAYYNHAMSSGKNNTDVYMNYLVTLYLLKGGDSSQQAFLNFIEKDRQILKLADEYISFLISQKDFYAADKLEKILSEY